MDPGYFFIYRLIFIPHLRRLQIAGDMLAGFRNFESSLPLSKPCRGVMSHGPAFNILISLSLEHISPCGRRQVKISILTALRGDFSLRWVLRLSLSGDLGPYRVLFDNML